MASEELTFLARKNLLEITPIIGNVSLACRLSNYSRTHYYRIKKLYETKGIEGLKPKTKKKPNLKNRLSLEIEKQIISLSLNHPLFGQSRISIELAKQDVLVCASSVRNIWLRHNIETQQKRLRVAQFDYLSQFKTELALGS